MITLIKGQSRPFSRKLTTFEAVGCETNNRVPEIVAATTHRPNFGLTAHSRCRVPQPRSKLATASEMEANTQHTKLKLTQLLTSPHVTFSPLVPFKPKSLASEVGAPRIYHSHEQRFHRTPLRTAMRNSTHKPVVPL